MNLLYSNFFLFFFTPGWVPGPGLLQVGSHRGSKIPLRVRGPWISFLTCTSQVSLSIYNTAKVIRMIYVGSDLRRSCSSSDLRLPFSSFCHIRTMCKRLTISVDPLLATRKSAQASLVQISQLKLNQRIGV
jgi:hypothetical protein